METSLYYNREKVQPVNQRILVSGAIWPEKNWVAVKELNLNYYIGETPLFSIYAHYCNILSSQKKERLTC